MAEPSTEPSTINVANPFGPSGMLEFPERFKDSTPEHAEPTPEPQRKAHRPLFIAYILLVVGGFVGFEVVLARQSPTLRPANVGAFMFFVALAFLAELRPLSWLGPSQKCELTASWTFFVCLFFSAPLPTAAAATTLICFVGFGLKRRPLVLSVFNACLGSLSIVLGALAIRVVHLPHADFGAGSQASISWIAGCLGLGLVGNLANLVLACAGVALRFRLRLKGIVRESVDSTLGTSLMMVGLAPAFLVTTRANLLVGVLLALTVAAVYKTSEIALGQRHEATHDPLTSLLNRQSFHEHVTETLKLSARRNQTCVLLRFNLEDFKGMNGRLGHAVGDGLLRKVAEQLRKERRAGDLLARLDADDFALLLASPCSREEALAVAEQILGLLASPLELGNVPMTIVASVGMAEFPAHGEDVDTLLDNADTALFRAKRARRGPEMYTEELSRMGPSRMALANEIREGIKHQQFFLVFQPKLDLHTGAIIGVEALLRWNHPERGMQFPDTFIPTAEQTDLMEDLTEYVLELAVQQCAAWHREGLFLSMAVNVSARNLHNHNFVGTVQRILQSRGLEPMWLELELTENTVMANPERTALVLEDLRGLGVQISLDDFGTGYSSLANLRTLPIDRIKIDKTFIFGMLASKNDQNIVRSVIDLAGSLGLGTVAEGVETQEVLDLLHQLGCEIVQGYFISKPISAVEIKDMCKDVASVPQPSRTALP